MTEQEARRWRPFHETIIDSICEAFISDLNLLARLIKRTKIPKGHDEIIAAWVQRLKILNWNHDYGVQSVLLEQKEEVEKSEEEEWSPLF